MRNFFNVFTGHFSWPRHGSFLLVLSLALSVFLSPCFAQGAAAGGVESSGQGRQTAHFTPPDPTRFGNAIELNDIETARVWLRQGLDPDYMADRIGSGLMIAAWEGNLPMMELFHTHGAQVNLKNAVGEQALLLAAWKGHRPAIDWLLAHGAELDRGDGQWSALHYAAFSGHKELVLDLLARGANIDARSPNGSTPLMLAIYDGQQEVAGLLLDRGADTRPKNDWGDGAMEWAMRFNQTHIARRMGSQAEFAAAASRPKESWGADRRSATMPEDLRKLIEAREYLIRKGLSVREIDRNISILRARYARASLPPRGQGATALEITASPQAPEKQSARIVTRPAPGTAKPVYRLPPPAPRKIPARK
jgi:hypothetical protein